MKQLTEEEYRNIYGGRPIIIIRENGESVVKIKFASF